MRTEITSSKNPRIRDLKKMKDKKHRTQQNAFLIEGLRFVREARLMGASIISYIISREDLKLLDEVGVTDDEDVLIVPGEILSELSSTVTPQGIMAAVTLPAPLSSSSFLERGGFWLYLDEIRDPGNLGTIIRSAHAFQVDGLILAKGTADPYQDKVLRSTMGSIFKVPLILDAGIAFLEKAAKGGVSLYLTDLHDAGELKDLTFEDSGIIVIGNEARGVQEAIRALPHRNLYIPMPGGAESLNAAVAASIIMYELKGRS